MEDSSPSRDQSLGPGGEALLQCRQELTDALGKSPYDLILYLRRAVVYSNLGYPDLAAGDAYKALLLTDDVLDESFEYHDQALESLEAHLSEQLPDVLRHGDLNGGGGSNGAEDVTMTDGDGAAHHLPPKVNNAQGLAALASTRCFQILSLSLLLCGCLKSAHEFCDRGLSASPGNQGLLNVREYIGTVARRRLRKHNFGVNDLPDSGVVRREVYPWNTHEPDRFSAESLGFLNSKLAAAGVAPKCEVRVSELPVLLEGASDTDAYDIIPTCSQLGLFAKEDIAPGEVVLREYSALTANNRLQEPVCDACGEELPPLDGEGGAGAESLNGEAVHGEEGGGRRQAISCLECSDTVFCSELCYSKATELYHPAVCDKDVDSIAKDPEAADVDHSLYLLLLARLLAMAAHQDLHPLDVWEVKYIWGDFVPVRSNEIDSSPKAQGPPPDWTLPFSFKFNIEVPLHVLEKMDIDIYATLARHDVWVFNTLYAKFRGTASARKNPRDGRPDVAAVHPLWCLANHDCEPNVTWEWGGRMTLRCRTQGGQASRKGWGGIKAGEEILNHYCDIDLPVQQRREWARGSLGGWCMCQRCRTETAAADAVVRAA